MTWSKRFATYFGIFILACAGALAGAPSAHAISNEIAQTQTLSVISQDGTHNIDVSDHSNLTWKDIILNNGNVAPDLCNNITNNSPNATCLTARANLQNLLNNYLDDRYYSVSQAVFKTQVNAGWEKDVENLSVVIMFQNVDNPLSLLIAEGDDWGSDVGVIWPTTGNTGIQVISFTVTNSGDFRFNAVRGSGEYSGIVNSIPSYENAEAKFLLYYADNFDSITYDPNWTGSTVDIENIPTTPPVQDVQSDQAPKWYLSGINNFQVSLHDSNFNTFDGNPFLCEDEFAPVLHWEITDDTPTVIFSGTQSATAAVTRTMPESDENESYTITGWYECAGYDFTETSSYTFEVTKYGTLFIDLFSDCVSETFPYIHAENCLENIYTVLNMMHDPDGLDFSYTTGCRQLYIAHEWLMRDDPTLCPLFPENIRNIITPFIAVTLGLITIGVIARLESSE